ncbi:Raffinose synthase family protein [Rhynchospora pubera]|uniref:galactinol--sucrose galactosyltransferase n=1 Tax=Rhynchospora pubera TaxID=906938 RepID=A0AAV8FQR0_9POAL|nr:Raffinose synthase family protein [Rhynchospora pubera]
MSCSVRCINTPSLLFSSHSFLFSSRVPRSLAQFSKSNRYFSCPPPLPWINQYPPICASKRFGVLEKPNEPRDKRVRKEGKEEEMTITTSIKISDRKLAVRGRTLLSGVPNSVYSSSAVTSGSVDGVFLGAEFNESSCRHVISLGKLTDVRFLSCFRFKLWWMAQKMGSKGSEIPHETQFLLLESKPTSDQEDELYTVFLPLVEGPFRASLQGNTNDDLELCIESGDVDTLSASFSHAIFVGTAKKSDPFEAISGAVAAVKSHLKTFRTRAEKKLPGIVDYFGWCTWDAFYFDVTQEGVEAGLRSLSDGGAPPRFVIIDDGWQSTEPDQQAESNPIQRLTGIKENNKFQVKGDQQVGIENIVKKAKEKYGLKYVYVWHAITGYWGGVRPGVVEMESYGSQMQYPKISPGISKNDTAMETDMLTLQGLGLVNPKSVYKFYNELHAYLAKSGVDGVKVDVQCVLETLGAGLGGRVQLTRQYHQALDASVAKNFPDNGIIACMSHNTDALYCSKQTAVVRASDDFYPRDPVSHTIHIASVAYNSVFLGEFMLPDWDMFHSLHPAAEYHGSARAISGGPIYVSDAPGKHNFEFLKKIVLPDGSILRARLPGRPTKDCLFNDPARDGVSLLKIWNINKYTGVIGVYNCQGAAWSDVEKKNMSHQTGTDALSCEIKGCDVHLISEASTDADWKGDCAVYQYSKGDLVVLPNKVAVPISLKVLEHDIFTVAPIKDLAPGYRFAPLGLIDMYNGGGAIEGLTYHRLDRVRLIELDSSSVDRENGSSVAMTENAGSEAVGMVCMEVKGCGRFGSYSSAKPRKCLVGSSEVEFTYNSSNGLLVIQLESMPKERVHRVVIEI